MLSGEFDGSDRDYFFQVVSVKREVFLEPPAARHAAELIAAVRRSRRLHGRWANAPSTREQYRDFLRRSRAPNRISRFVRTSDGDLAGVVNISEIVLGYFRSAYLSYYAFVPYHRRGYMSAGVSAMIQLAFREYRLHRLEANIQPENAASIALVRGLGFELEGYSPRYLKIAGRWRDHERWAIRSETWKPKRA
jgi:[ribosomal protein S5]-alanine N-acetyltransferase